MTATRAQSTLVLLPKFTTEYRDRRTGSSHLSQIEADSAQEARAIVRRRGLGERLTALGPENVDRARTAQPSECLSRFLHERSLRSGLDALDAVSHLAHLAASGDEKIEMVGLLSDAGLFQAVLRIARVILLAAETPSDTDALLAELRVLESQVDGLPSDAGRAQSPSCGGDAATENRRLRSLLLQAVFDLERLSIQPTRSEEDRQALHDRAQGLRWGLSERVHRS